jgi:hypothetical protein
LISSAVHWHARDQADPILEKRLQVLGVDVFEHGLALDRFSMDAVRLAFG